MTLAGRESDCANRDRLCHWRKGMARVNNGQAMAQALARKGLRFPFRSERGSQPKENEDRLIEPQDILVVQAADA